MLVDWIGMKAKIEKKTECGGTFSERIAVKTGRWRRRRRRHQTAASAASAAPVIRQRRDGEGG